MSIKEKCSGALSILKYKTFKISKHCNASAGSKASEDYLKQQKQRYGLRKSLSESISSNEILHIKLNEFLHAIGNQSHKRGV
jgi:hypothetical protein